MIQLLVIPEVVFDQYKADGVQFKQLLCPNYIASVSSTTDLIEIDAAINEFHFKFCPATPVKLADSPVLGIALKATNINDDNYIFMKDLHYRLKERMDTHSLTKGNKEPLVHLYTLYPVDENLWVAVQKSLPTENSDPTLLSIKLNHSFFDSMINELTRSCSFEQVVTTSIFTNYLESHD